MSVTVRQRPRIQRRSPRQSISVRHESPSAPMPPFPPLLPLVVPPIPLVPVAPPMPVLPVVAPSVSPPSVPLLLDEREDESLLFKLELELKREDELSMDEVNEDEDELEKFELEEEELELNCDDEEERELDDVFDEDREEELSTCLDDEDRDELFELPSFERDELDDPHAALHDS